jgi:hypothetical protein
VTGDFDTRAQSVCLRALEWAERQDYRGYSKHDALSSPLLRTLSLGLKWGRIGWIQLVMRSPLNLRPLLGVPKRRNAKGIALFARAWLNLYELTGRDEYREKAENLLNWLLDHPSSGFQGLSWGYPYDWQDLGFYAPAGFPNRIVTYFVGRALVHGYDVTGRVEYLEAALAAVDFLLGAPKVLYEDERMKCLSYVPVPSIEMAVMDVSALVGALCTMAGSRADRPDLIEEGVRLARWVADKQTDAGAWYYTHPPGDSHITHDNYHTGEILDALRDVSDESGDDEFLPVYRKGLDFYREHLFMVDARPKWMFDRTYPHDAHGYAQGIIPFTRSGEIDLARRIAGAAIDDLWRSPRFAYQKRRLYTKNFTLMRWSQAWLVHALALHVAAITTAPGAE